ncbi:PREDICTED: uncharacterized protein LOC109221421 [Nicotiana attenuata]|uniref:uncharacterized protein LOC109221421 n=1 Tax=Nicotiana attenuata TaxID=49451 RepID=UPI000905C1C3|nr:PREDICTED: uncharacterized protein LOC109221421 [Nicotiana attenuata]
MYVPTCHLPVGFKTPKFEKYDGHGDPIAHLKRYCNQLRGASGKEELLMAYFGESLVGIASEWYMDEDISRWHIWDNLARDFVRQFQYNIDIAPDRNSLSNLKKKSSKSFREYAVKWREQAARVKPPMDEKEMVSVFLQAQEADYFQNMMSAMGKLFAEAIKIGEMVENGLKIGRILSQSTIRATSQAIQSGSGGVANRKKKEEAAMAASVMNAQPYARPQQQFNQNRAPPPRNNPPHQAQYNPRPPQNNFPYNARAREPPRRTNFTAIGESYSSLFPKLVQMGLLQPVPQTRKNPESPSYQPGARCAYHSGAEGHDTEDCWTLKRAVENLIEQKRIVLKDEEIPNVTNNPLPAHNNGPKPKAAAKQDKGKKKNEPTPQSAEKEVETKTGAVPPKDAILHVPRGHTKEQTTLSPPKRFELNRGPKMYVPKGTYVVRGPIISPWLNEPVVIGCAPQRPMTDPTDVPWNYNRAVVTYKGKEVLEEANETNPAEKYLNLEDLNKAKKKRFPPKKPVSAEEAEEFFRKMKTADYEVIDQL